MWPAVYGSFASTVAFSVSIASSELCSSRLYDSSSSRERRRSRSVWLRRSLDAPRTKSASATYSARKTTASATQSRWRREEMRLSSVFGSA